MQTSQITYIICNAKIKSSKKLMGTVDSRFSLHFYTTPPLSEFYPHAQVIEKWKKMENLLNMLVVERN